jgi:hypothetical protein
MAMIDITGLRFGQLTAISPTKKRNKDGTVFWLCKCDCGNEIITNGNRLRSGHTKSCGCLRKGGLQKAHIARRKHFGCMYCGSDKHYAKGLCRTCYDKKRRGVL